jgi:hypothetical protein
MTSSLKEDPQGILGGIQHRIHGVCTWTISEYLLQVVKVVFRPCDFALDAIK